MTEVNIVDSPKVMKKIGRKKPLDLRVKRSNNMHPMIQEEYNNDTYFYGLIPKELSDNIQGMILKGLALPARQKQQYMYGKLLKSDYINKYLKKYLSLDIIAGLNDHVKALLVYAILFMETMMMRVLTPDEVADLMKKTNDTNK